jgi:hypothetical protein
MDVNILEDRESKALVLRGGKYLLAESEIEEGNKQDPAGALFEGAAWSMEIGISSDGIDISMRRHYG